MPALVVVLVVFLKLLQNFYLKFHSRDMTGPYDDIEERFLGGQYTPTHRARRLLRAKTIKEASTEELLKELKSRGALGMAGAAPSAPAAEKREHNKGYHSSSIVATAEAVDTPTTNNLTQIIAITEMASNVVKHVPATGAATSQTSRSSIGLLAAPSFMSATTATPTVTATAVQPSATRRLAATWPRYADGTRMRDAFDICIDLALGWHAGTIPDVRNGTVPECWNGWLDKKANKCRPGDDPSLPSTKKGPGGKL